MVHDRGCTTRGVHDRIGARQEGCTTGWCTTGVGGPRQEGCTTEGSTTGRMHDRRGCTAGGKGARQEGGVHDRGGPRQEGCTTQLCIYIYIYTYKPLPLPLPDPPARGVHIRSISGESLLNLPNGSKGVPKPTADSSKSLHKLRLEFSLMFDHFWLPS